jgi:hypothetical protein
VASAKTVLWAQAAVLCARRTRCCAYVDGAAKRWRQAIALQVMMLHKRVAALLEGDYAASVTVHSRGACHGTSVASSHYVL